ncbi:MAG: sigma-70 family RNA polymerase sigma factor [Deltaproteobacteria bacterium]|nr:sigma-70 family RNA polymerase sigma factor [Deltaproteobacteria bacterium]
MRGGPGEPSASREIAAEEPGDENAEEADVSPSDGSPSRVSGAPERGPSGAEDVNSFAAEASEPVPAAVARLATVGGSAASEEGEEDRQLVRRAQQGDRKAFQVLVVRYQRRAYAVAFGIVKNRQDALDVLQEAFIKVHRYIGSFQGTSSFYTWLYRIVVNLAIDHKRKEPRGRGTEFDERVGRDEAEVAGDGSLLPKVLGGNPGKVMARKELMQKLEEAMEQLPPYHRAVILMREIEGLSYEEMAKALDVPKGTIMSRLFHARRKLQEALGPYLEGDLDID